MISGVQRRDVRNALALLEDAGLIERVLDAPKSRRSVTWRILAPHEVLWRARGPATVRVAGEPATSTAPDLDGAPLQVAGHPAIAGDAPEAGRLAGSVAGNMAGHPAPKGSELNLLMGNKHHYLRENRHCRVHAHWNHEARCRACMRDRQAEADAGERLPALHELTSAERSIVDDAVRGFLRGEMPAHLIRATEEARIAREMAS